VNEFIGSAARRATRFAALCSKFVSIEHHDATPTALTLVTAEPANLRRFGDL
jgi:hypothetical protein